MIEIKKVSLKNFTSLHIGGKASVAIVTTEDELVEVVRHAQAFGLRVHILGSGTNTFFGEYLENLLVIKIESKGITSQPVTTNNVLLTIGAGEIWDNIVTFAAKENLWGIENLAYIPGTIGAAPVQNIGAYGVELADAFYVLRAYDMQEEKFVELFLEDCQFGYRDSIFKHKKGRYCIVSVTLKLSTIKNPVLTYKPLNVLKEKHDVTLQEIRDLLIQTRTSKLPDYNLYPNAGSFFKNVVIDSAIAEGLRIMYPRIDLHETEDGYKVPTAWLIEHVAEMKGVRVGDVGTWPAQPLVLVNYGDTTGESLMSFSQAIIDTVKEKTGIILEREVNYVV